ncbi:hypothetical protein PACTADRAFT_185122 [Pachysolen tannophilus NRRL Y-2460]|uniref:NAD+ kinase n=1 Tax=Pachysolen tannophilus NRRL Y-2460 TaxID=669874 RepID=A0A1E4U310_PACTA|nr:hypothetical protein PACTADRAFT_185122 [Pachysolen tannophilus NRRL Y-2460]
MSRSSYSTSTSSSQQQNIKDFSTPEASPQNKNVKIKSVQDLRSRQLPEYVSSPTSKLHNLIWTEPIQNVFIVKKPWQPHVRDAMIKFISFLHKNYPSCNVIVERDVADEILLDFHSFPLDGNEPPHVLYTGEPNEIIGKTDLLVTLGGDGTILRGVSLFSNTVVPPVLSFSLGTLGFLLPYDFSHHVSAFKEVYSSRAKALHRTRVECHIVKDNESSAGIHAMNDVVLHRGSSPSLATLDIYIDGEFLTGTTGDGVVFATPTGSTAYSLSSGGSIVNPLVPSILLTPICPRSLSFRPLILPSTTHIMVKIGSKNNSQSSVKLSIDGVSQTHLSKGDEIHVISETGTIYLPHAKRPLDNDFERERLEEEEFVDIRKKAQTVDRNKYKGIWCIAKSENDWVRGINELLGFNSGFKGFNRTEVDTNPE